jgi:hypothetical protein
VSLHLPSSFIDETHSGAFVWLCLLNRKKIENVREREREKEKKVVGAPRRSQSSDCGTI